MPQHKTRKQIRQETAAVTAELNTLKSPEGIADYVYSKRDDEDFEEKLHARFRALRDAEPGDEPAEPPPAAPPVKDSEASV